MRDGLRIESLGFSYGHEELFSDFSINFQAGQLHAILGPNGSGKSSLLRLMAGLEKKYEGKIFLQGRDIKKISQKEFSQKLGFMGQLEEVKIPFTLEQNILLGRSPWQSFFGSLGKDDIMKVKKAMDLLGLSHLKDRDFHKLSGGEQQRGLFARLLCQETDLYLLDEASSALDYAHQIILMESLKNLVQEGATVILASHDVNIASMYADRLYLLGRGKLLAEGEADKVLNAENLKELYQWPIFVGTNPHTGKPFILPELRRNKE